SRRRARSSSLSELRRTTMKRQLCAALFGVLASAGAVATMGPRGGGMHAAPHASPSLSGAHMGGQRPAPARPSMGPGAGHAGFGGGGQRPNVSGFQRPQGQTPNLQHQGGPGAGRPAMSAAQRPISLPGGVHPGGGAGAQHLASPGGGGGMIPQRPSLAG